MTPPKYLLYAMLTTALFSSFCFAGQEVVVIPDKDLEKIICEARHKKPPLTRDDLLALKVLEDFGGNIQDLRGIEHALNLENLTISSNKISDISAISNLVKLQELRLWSNKISDIGVLKNLKKLSVLILNDNQIEDISVLTGLPNLSRLTLQRNPLNEKAYKEVIPKLKEINPKMTIYHDRAMTPEKSLYFAQKYTIPILIVLGVLYFSTLHFLKKKVRKSSGIKQS